MRYHSTPMMTTIIFLKRKTTNVGEDVGKMGPKCLAGGDGKWHSSCRKRLRMSSKSATQSHYTTQQFHSYPKRTENICSKSHYMTQQFHSYPKRAENMHSNKIRLTNTQSIIIHNSQKAETTQMPISWWTDKQNVVHPHCGLPLSRKKEWSPNVPTTRWSLETWCHETEGRPRRIHIDSM